MHGPINVKSPNNVRKWQMGFNSAFIGLKRVLRKYNVWAETCGSEGGQMAGSCEQGNEPGVSIKVANFFSR
jgi:hypothetical protein